MGTGTSDNSPDGSAFDAVVIGGGPAGSTFATFMARAGRRVLIVEGKQFPRDHIGESLLAVSMPILDEMGMRPALEANGFPVKRGAIFVWGPTRAEMKLAMPKPGFAYQVTRSKFDQLLLDHAQESGATVWQEHWVKSPIWDEGRMVGVVVSPSGQPSKTVNVRARHVVDASGLFQYLPRKLEMPIDLFGPQRAAISGYVSGAGRYPEPYRNDILSEASQDGWLWYIPLSDDLTSVGFVGDQVDLQGSPGEMLLAQIRSAPITRDLMGGSVEVRKPRLLKYTNHSVRAPLWDRGYIIVGDAGIFVDPLFSTGVHGALYSAKHAAAGVLAVLAGELREDEVSRWYDQRFRRHYQRIQAQIQLLYGLHPGESRFWSSRSCLDLDVAQARQLVQHTGPAGMDFFQRMHDSGALPLPPVFTDILPEVNTRMRPSPLPMSASVRLATGVVLQPSFTVDRGRLVPSLAFADELGHTHELEFSSGSRAHQVLTRLEGDPTVGELTRSLEDVQGFPIERVPVLLGSLVDGGLLTVVND